MPWAAPKVPVTTKASFGRVVESCLAMKEPSESQRNDPSMRRSAADRRPRTVGRVREPWSDPC